MLASIATIAHAQVAPDIADPSVASISQTNISAAQLFAMADRLREQSDFSGAEAAYRALTQDNDVEIRTEARFRLGLMLADNLKRYSDAATVFRRILDDKPEAGRVRLELARMQAILGNMGAARKELRAAQATGLPAAVDQLVRFYSRALNARKPFGGSFEIALAPDSNINRATRSSTLGTVIGEFSLNEDARARSGTGLDLRGQAYVRMGIEPGSDLLVRASAESVFFRDADFNDISASLQAGPQYTWGGNQITVWLGPSRRWYGRDLFSTTFGGGVGWQHTLGKRGQLRIDGSLSHLSNKRNALQTSNAYTLSAALDRAFSARFGGGIQTFGFREVARDPGYSLASGGLFAYLFRELGRTTLVGTIAYSHLEADKRLFLYPRRRIENRYTASLAATLRALQVSGFAPLVRVKWERNRSSIEIYDYRRAVAEFGITSAF